ncbi:hypothetical protein K8M07_00370 [Schnuerera sp. xch1]|uniref:hypothetical protein n=1 Tax=Schnuerera sp. xch1 TaxID=2874283 RepID=UPI001CBD1117|nr:hypothetical protein [Schnuerera sp. xch1]MBZ2173703.1 hypothetical protein [Schnuerera sp. xch1]
MNDFKIENLGEILETLDADCLVVDKVFASCQQRECFPHVEVDLDEKNFRQVKFKPGFIVPNTLVITDIDDTPNFRRVRFTLRIPYEITAESGKVIKKFLPDILNDIVLYIPDARDEFEFKIVVETSSQILGQTILIDDTLTFAAGAFIIVKVVGKVQLLVPTFGYCPPPESCDEFNSEDVYDNFDYLPFPDFFPPKFQEPNT